MGIWGGPGGRGEEKVEESFDEKAERDGDDDDEPGLHD